MEMRDRLGVEDIVGRMPVRVAAMDGSEVVVVSAEKGAWELSEALCCDGEGGRVAFKWLAGEDSAEEKEEEREKTAEGENAEEDSIEGEFKALIAREDITEADFSAGPP